MDNVVHTQSSQKRPLKKVNYASLVLNASVKYLGDILILRWNVLEIWAPSPNVCWSPRLAPPAPIVSELFLREVLLSLVRSSVFQLQELHAMLLNFTWPLLCLHKSEVAQTQCFSVVM